MFAVGVVEGDVTKRIREEVAQAVGTRTVSSMNDIRTMCEESEVLAILFRHDRTIREDIPLRVLMERGALTSRPQSIVGVEREGEAGLRAQIQR